MAEDLLVALRAEVFRHPWWQARTRLALSILRRYGIARGSKVIDIGCGWGTTLAGLERAGYVATGLDVSRRALEVLDRENPKRRLIEADIEKPFSAGWSFDAALALDVIEHLDDDRGALQRMHGLVRPGGLVIVSVPARPDLFSEFDVVQGHRRRYLPPTLRSAFDGTGFVLDCTLYWGNWMVPLLRYKRAARHPPKGFAAVDVYTRHLALPPRPGPELMKVLFWLDERWSLSGRSRTGTSLVAIARAVDRNAGGAAGPCQPNQRGRTPSGS